MSSQLVLGSEKDPGVQRVRGEHPWNQRGPAVLELGTFGKLDVLVRQGHHSKVPQAGDFNSRNVFSDNSGGWKSEIKVSAGLVSCDTSLLGLHMAVFSLCLHMVSPLDPSVSKCPCLIKIPGILDQGLLKKMTSFYLNHLCKGPVSKYSHILRYWGLGFQHMNFGGHSSAHNTW